MTETNKKGNLKGRDYGPGHHRSEGKGKTHHFGGLALLKTK